MNSLEPLLSKLAEAQSDFFRTADGIALERWRTRPGPEQWSAAEVVAHLVVVERAVVGSADRVTQKPPRYIPYWKRVHLPMWLVESRIVRRKSPLPQDTGLIGHKEDMLAELRGVRERTLAFLEETKKRDLSVYCWRHAFLGMLNVYEWFEMIAAHQVRHTKQVKEISEALPKAVESH